MKTISTMLLTASLLGLAGCGGGGSSTAPETGIQSGVVADGLLSNAKVCLDVNENRVCDTSEPTATTDINGAYRIENASAVDASHTFLVVVTAGVTSDSDYGVVAASYNLSAPAGKGAFISPITTLVQGAIDSGAAADVAAAETQIAAALGSAISKTADLYANFTTPANAATLGRLQGVAQIVAQSLADTKTAAATAGMTPLQASAAASTLITGLPIIPNVVTGPLTKTDRDTVYASVSAAITPTAAQLTMNLALQNRTQPEPIEGAWRLPNAGDPANLTDEIFVFLPGGKYHHQRLINGTFGNPTAGFSYGRYSFANGVITFKPVEKGENEGPNAEAVSITLSGNTLATSDATFTRITSTSSPMNGVWVPLKGFQRPEFIVFQNSAYTYWTLPFEAQAATLPDRYTGYQRGGYTFNSTSGTVTRGATSVDTNGTFELPATMTLNADGSLNVGAILFVKIGTTLGAKATLDLAEGIQYGRYVGKFLFQDSGSNPSGMNRITYIKGVDNLITYTPDQGGNGSTLCATFTDGIKSINPARENKLFQLDYANKVARIGTAGSVALYQLKTYAEMDKLFPRARTTGCSQPN